MAEFKIAHINARSILAGFAGFRDTLVENDYDIFLVSESWLGAEVEDDFVSIGGYDLVRDDRVGRRGGGVCMYIKNDLKFELIELGQYSYEQLWIKLTISKKRYCVGVVYRTIETSVSEFLDSFEEVFFNIVPVCDHVLCMGDINIDLLDLDDNGTKKFNSLIDDLNLQQLISEPTRLSLTKNSLLDIVICSKDTEIGSSGVEYLNNLRTDHELVYCYLKETKNRFTPVYKTFRDYSNFDYDKFVLDLCSLPLIDIVYINDIDEKIQHFNNLVLSLFDRHAPLRNIRCTKPNAPWLTQNIRFMINLKNEAKSRYLRTSDPLDYSRYKSFRNFTTTMVNNEKKAYLNQLIKGNKSKRLWKELHNLNVYSSKKKDCCRFTHFNF